MTYLSKEKTYDIMEICMLAGSIMLQNGGETYRVEDTMTRIAVAYGVTDSDCFVTPTGIILSLEGSEPTKTKLNRILDRTTNLEKVVKVNDISRKISTGTVSMKEAYYLLKDVENEECTYNNWMQITAAAFASGCFLIMFDGVWKDFIPALIAGGLGFLCSNYFHRVIQIKFFAEFSASFVIGIIAFLSVWIGFGAEADKIIIGSVMPLVPGLLITNAVRDLIAGHLVSGISKGADAFLTASAIGTGIAVAFFIF
ncbi:threonine/serine exporter family protein [Bacillus sp. B1-b2]|uniref:threonine/serine exporter family protein n=1 Tax=Bacillus sp. B1-b2 TaxID=2653201 RepID=UPI001261B484|nr:threonine/serine exporter family protein [Bacillus sp. B1-b2]KAB7670650.1 threonine/serine exporter family protein [Bacillus sp. B1-b2]